METMDLDLAKKVVGIGKSDAEKEMVLKCFSVKYFTMRENNELEILKVIPEYPSIKTAEDELILAKNTLTRKFVEEQYAEEGHFRPKENVPFDHICNACNGLGELYKFFRGTKALKCRICLGEPEVWVKCHSCNGTGIFRAKPEHNGVTCLTCIKFYENYRKDPNHDPKKLEYIKGKILFRCSECRGTGERRIVIITSEIESTTPCRKCNQLGFIIPRPRPKFKAASNPVLSTQIASKIRETINSSNEKEEEIIEDACVCESKPSKKEAKKSSD